MTAMIVFLVPAVSACSLLGDAESLWFDDVQNRLRTGVRDELKYGQITSTNAAVPQPGTAAQDSSPTPELFDFPLSDWKISDGHFFRHSDASGGPAGSLAGFSVTNSHGVPFYDAFRQLGGAPVIGPPVTQRFILNGRITQVFRDVILQWNEETKHVEPMNLLDEMSLAGLDEWLGHELKVPPPLEASFDTGRTREEVAKKRLDLLNQRPVMRVRFYGMSDPLSLLGLPASSPTDAGNSIALRFQRGVMHEWIRDTTSNRAGEVTVVSASEILLALGVIPDAARAPELATGTIIVAEPATADEQVDESWPAGKITNIGRDRLRLRHYPDGDTVALLTEGESLKLLSRENVVGWVRIRTAAGTGWVMSQYVEVEQPAPAESP